MMPEKTLNHLVVKLIFDYAVRSLLGGGKGEFVMEQLERDSPELHGEVMKAAKIYLEQRERQRLEAARMWEDGMLRLAEDLGKERSN